MAEIYKFQYLKLFLEKNNLVQEDDDSASARQLHLMTQLLALTEMVIYKLYDGDLILTQCSVVIRCLFEYAATQIAVEPCKTTTEDTSHEERTPQSN